MKTILALIIAFASFTAFADTLTWNWTAPTARADSTPFNMATEGAGYHVWINNVQEMNGANPLLLGPGTTQFSTVVATGTVCAEFATVDVDGRVSARSSAVCTTVVDVPNPPQNITVTITIQ